MYLGDSEFPRFWHPPWYTSTARPGPRPGGDRGFCRARILGSLSLHDFLTSCPARRRRRPTRMMRSSRGPTPRICSRVRASRHPNPGSCLFFYVHRIRQCKLLHKCVFCRNGLRAESRSRQEVGKLETQSGEMHLHAIFGTPKIPEIESTTISQNGGNRFVKLLTSPLGSAGTTILHVGF